MPYINFNGELFSSDEPVLKTGNRSFCYGDALFETMRWHDNKILFIHDHVLRLFKGMKFLKMEIPKKYSASFFQKQISQLLKRTKISGDARIRLQVYRNEGGYHTPTNNSVGFVITTEGLSTENYFLNKKGLTVDIFSEIKKLKNPVSNFKTSNSLIYTLAGIFAKENNLDDCLILNTDGYIADAISSNIFIVKNKIVFTPPLPDGCVHGVMRKNILKICKQEKISSQENSINENDLLMAEEIFLSNVIQGIRWVKSFRKKAYSNDSSRFLNAKLKSSVGRN
ncbi:MAG TPA: aminotransferase class IV [Bacteroidia bacterium]|nr:aminotransferase class IV [Bacteroidia bacterium]